MVVPTEGMPVTVGIDGALVDAGEVGVGELGALVVPPHAERSKTQRIVSMVNVLDV
jgi:hypothetical protein